MVKLNAIKKGYVNTSKMLYSSEFLNLVNLDDGKVSFDERTLFLTDGEKKELNTETIQRFDNFVAVINIEGHYGLICDVPIEEYNSGKIKSHELVLPEVIQGMLSNFQGYNAETAPVLLLHDSILHLEGFVSNHLPEKSFNKGNIELYVYSGDAAQTLVNKYAQSDYLYIGDGHHRLYSTSISHFKDEMLAMVMDFNQIEIQPIHRMIVNVTESQFKKSMQFINQKFQTVKLLERTPPLKNYINIYYKDEAFQIKLIELLSDGFWNNDIYRVNTQIISQAFRIFDNSRVKFLDSGSFEQEKLSVDSESVLIEVSAMSKDEFINSAKNGNILPPKTTWMHPKCPSFLLIHQYKE